MTYRTLLFIPGNNPGMLQNSDILGADALIIDLEDFRKSYEQDSKGKVYVDGIHFHSNFQDALVDYLASVLD